MNQFASFTEAGQLLAVEVLDRGNLSNACVIALNARGQIVGRAVAERLGLPCATVEILRNGDVVTTTGLPEVRGRSVVVVDDGVESGTAARAVAAALRDQEAARIVLAVPVCPAQLMAGLRKCYDELLVVHACTDGLALAGHYLEFDRLS